MDEKKRETSRIVFWDNLKFSLILLVVVGHFAEQYIKSGLFKSIFIFIYTFHMPLFIYISGMFHKNEKIIERVYGFIAIGFLMKIILFIEECWIESEVLEFDFWAEDAIPWYMFAMAAFIILTYLLKNIDYRAVLLMAVLLACFAGYDKQIGDFLILSRILVFFPFYYMGYLLKNINMQSYIEGRNRYIIGIVIIVGWIICCVFMRDKVYLLRPMFTGRNSFPERYAMNGCIVRLLCYIISTIVGIGWLSIIPSKRVPLISKFGQRTIQVYFWHFPMLLFLIKFDILDMCNSRFGKIFYMLIAIVITILFSFNIFKFPVCFLEAKTDRRNKGQSGLTFKWLRGRMIRLLK